MLLALLWQAGVVVDFGRPMNWPASGVGQSLFSQFTDDLAKHKASYRQGDVSGLEMNGTQCPWSWGTVTVVADVPRLPA